MLDGPSSTWQQQKPTAVDVQLPRRGGHRYGVGVGGSLGGVSSSATGGSTVAPTRGLTSASSLTDLGFGGTAQHHHKHVSRDSSPDVSLARSVLDRQERRWQTSSTGALPSADQASSRGAATSRSSFGSMALPDLSSFRAELRRFELERARDPSATGASATSVAAVTTSCSSASSPAYTVGLGPPALEGGCCSASATIAAALSGSAPATEAALPHSWPRSSAAGAASTGAAAACKSVGTSLASTTSGGDVGGRQGDLGASLSLDAGEGSLLGLASVGGGRGVGGDCGSSSVCLTSKTLGSTTVATSGLAAELPAPGPTATSQESQRPSWQSSWASRSCGIPTSSATTADSTVDFTGSSWVAGAAQSSPKNSYPWTQPRSPPRSPLRSPPRSPPLPPLRYVSGDSNTNGQLFVPASPALAIPASPSALAQHHDSFGGSAGCGSVGKNGVNSGYGKDVSGDDAATAVIAAFSGSATASGGDSVVGENGGNRIARESNFIEKDCVTWGSTIGCEPVVRSRLSDDRGASSTDTTAATTPLSASKVAASVAPPSESTKGVECWRQSLTEVRLLEQERELARLNEMLDQSRQREAAVYARERRTEEQYREALAELREARTERDAPTADRGDCQEVRDSLVAILAAEEIRDNKEATGSLTELAAAVASAFEARRRKEEELTAAASSASTSYEAPWPLHAARELVAAGAKLWRLQQAQRSLTSGAGEGSQRGGSCGAPAGGRGRGRGAVARPLYVIPPAKKVGDDIAAQLLTEMAQALREIERAGSLASPTATASDWKSRH
eukprot:TRINITY_DN44832_c0_g1_i1.p1 TRINITY_DN44832_c0_g1~~TRINITY_DN44832_c0_g1_i1.p1  ORF type:complete len:793 (-),score=152.06 TRINITY_DN44832_c0_g1_i1:35-2413(-)